jgi:hypothetical protein
MAGHYVNEPSQSQEFEANFNSQIENILRTFGIAIAKAK